MPKMSVALVLFQVLTPVWVLLNGAPSQPTSLHPKIFIKSGSKRWQVLADILHPDARKSSAVSRNLAPTLNIFHLWLRRCSGGLVAPIARFRTTGSNRTRWSFTAQTRKRLMFLQRKTVELLPKTYGRSQRLMEIKFFMVRWYNNISLKRKHWIEPLVGSPNYLLTKEMKTKPLFFSICLKNKRLLFILSDVSFLHSLPFELISLL